MSDPFVLLVHNRGDELARLLADPQWIAKFKEVNKIATLLNALPFADALALYIADARKSSDYDWTGKPAPEAPEDWWIADRTGEYVHLVSDKRMSPEAARAIIASGAKVDEEVSA